VEQIMINRTIPVTPNNSLNLIFTQMTSFFRLNGFHSSNQKLGTDSQTWLR
jgi:hypothetical protein